MKRNLGDSDKIIRLIVAVIIATMYFGGLISGTLAIVLGLLAIVFSLTAFINFCPLYSIFGWSTFKKKA